MDIVENPKRKNNFDPFNPEVPEIKDSDKKNGSNMDDGINVLYITGIIIFCLIIIWIILIIFTRESNVAIIDEMLKQDSQAKLALDL